MWGRPFNTCCSYRCKSLRFKNVGSALLTMIEPSLLLVLHTVSLVSDFKQTFYDSNSITHTSISSIDFYVVFNSFINEMTERKSLTVLKVLIYLYRLLRFGCGLLSGVES